MKENISSQLATSLGINSSEPNKAVAKLCIKNPKLLEDINKNFSGKDEKLIADSAEVMTEVSNEHPELVVKFAACLIPFIKHKYTRARWEAMHALANLSKISPEIIESLLPDLQEIIEKDKSTIVRDHATSAISIYAGTGAKAAALAFPLMLEILNIWKEKQAARVMTGMLDVLKLQKGFRKDIQKVVDEYKDSDRGVAKKAALKLEKALTKI